MNYIGTATDEIQAKSVTSIAAVIGGQPVVPNISAVTVNSTVGAAMLTAAQLAGAEQVNLLRSGSTGAYSDTTDTAANIIAAINAAVKAPVPIGFTYLLVIANTVAFIETLVGGTGVTITGTATLAASSTRNFSVQVTGAATVTMTSLGSGSL